jgi:hypothetical protein
MGLESPRARQFGPAFRVAGQVEPWLAAYPLKSSGTPRIVKSDILLNRLARQSGRSDSQWN